MQNFKSRISEVWRISWPLIIANSFWNLQVSIDRIFLGEYSTETLGAAIAAVGFFWAPMALVQQTSAYLTTFVAQYTGAKQPQWIGPSVWQSIYVSLIGGTLFLILVPISPAIFAWMGHSPMMQSLEVEYFQALAYSALPTALVAACSGFYTGIGRSRIIMLINGVGLVLNIGLDYALIFGNWGMPSLGLAGAGYATALSAYGASFLGLYLIFTDRKAEQFQLRKSFGLNLELLGRFIRYGFPSGLQWALEGLAFTFFLAFIGRLPNGDSALAASSVTVTIMMLAILPVIGVAQGVSALVGQHLGEDQPQQAVAISWAGVQLSMFYIVSIGFSFLCFPHFFLELFSGQGDSPLWPEVQAIVPTLLQFVSVFILFDTLNMIFSFTLKGAGDTRFVSFVALLLPWPLMVIPSWYFASWENGVYWSWGAASLFICVQGLVFLGRFLQGRWKSMRVI